MRPFQIQIPQQQIDLLHRKIDDTIWPAESWQAANDWSYGTPEAYLRELVDYWRHSFDWRAAEARLNAYPQFMSEIDGLETHFIHARSSHENARPLLLVHGWPGSVVEFLDAIPRLTQPEKFGGNAADAFHVVCPSLPGYGYSQTIQKPGMDPKRIAALHAKLMSALGYEKFVAQGGDWGAICCRFLADIAPERLTGLHLNLSLPMPPTGLEDAEKYLTEAERAFVANWPDLNWDISGYSHEQATKPQTVAYGLSDSPVALAGWITEKFHGWTDNGGDLRDAVNWDDLLTNISLYWFTGSIGSAVRLYKEFTVTMNAPLPLSPICEVPTGMARYPKEIWLQPRSWSEMEYNIVHWYEPPKGGHFAAMEQPEIFANDLLAFNRRLADHPAG
ncbi:MAG: alpha/beta fold hydrolase [Caenibius sp.]